MSETINVIGLGYIGLPTALMMASKGLKVIGTDYDKEKVEKLAAGEITFQESGLEELFHAARNNKIVFSSEYHEADYYIVAVPTPFDKFNKKVVADYLVAAVKSVVQKCKMDSIIVIESTISPGTIDHFIRPIVNDYNEEHKLHIHLAHAPERIIPGKMIDELLNNNRTIGADSTEIAQRVKNIYQVFCNGEIILTNIKTAELSKVVENSYRDVNIAFANELVKICEEADIDVYELINIANKHPRVNILSPGPGVGGHCISVDPWFLVGDYPGLANIILAARKINDSMPGYVLRKVSKIMEENNIESLSRVGLYGISYKENVDDVRESPTLQLVERMKENLAKGIKAYDPYINQDILDNQYHDLTEFLNDIDLVIVMVGHDEIKKNQHMLENKIVFDTRNIITVGKVYKM